MFSSPSQTTQTPVKPSSIRPGDTIAIVSPAAPSSPDALQAGVRLLESAGFQAKLFPHAASKHSYLAGQDTERLADLHAAFADPKVKAILCARGGYGCMRLLPQLDLDLVRQHPKVFIGFSDVTALHLAFYQQTGLTTFYGPMLTSNLVHNEPYSQAELLKLVTKGVAYPYTLHNRDRYSCFKPGMVKAPLIGGNLSLLAALCGTPWQPKTDGHLLFIEDWKEKYYSLDRQFQQLRLAGMFQHIAGLILCDFSEIECEPDWPLAEQLRRLTEELDVPCGYGLSVGHGEQTATLPIGTLAHFDASTGHLTLEESPCS